MSFFFYVGIYAWWPEFYMYVRMCQKLKYKTFL